jgi:hypothetical protein
MGTKHGKWPSTLPSSPALYLFKLNYVFFGVWVPYRTGIFKCRPNNLSLMPPFKTTWIKKAYGNKNGKWPFTLTNVTCYSSHKIKHQTPIKYSYT